MDYCEKGCDAPINEAGYCPQCGHRNTHRDRGPKLYGFMTGVNWFSFMNAIEDATADRIDWTAIEGRATDPWPPDVWIEGNNGAAVMRVSYKLDRTEFAYAFYTDRNGEIDTRKLAASVVTYIEGRLREDPEQISHARRS